MPESGKPYRVYRGGRTRGLLTRPFSRRHRGPWVPADDGVIVDDDPGSADDLDVIVGPDGEWPADPVVDPSDDQLLGVEPLEPDPGPGPYPPPRPHARRQAPKPERTRRFRWRWIWRGLKPLLIIALLALLAIVAWGTAGYFGLRGGVTDANERLDDAARNQLVGADGWIVTSPRTILFLGVDTGALREDSGRSDAIVLMRTDPGDGRLSLLSIPRDLRVEVPTLGLDKVNSAYAHGGTALAIETVQRLTNVPINHVAVVDFDGFEEVIDTLGGVDVTVPKRIVSNRFDCPYASTTRCASWEGWEFGRGTHTMDGKRALTYARIRTNQLDDSESDVTRGGRQQEVLNAVVDKLVSVNTFAQLPWVGGGVTGPLATDLSTRELLELAVVKFRASDDKTVHCRLGGSPTEIDGISYLTGSEENSSVVNMFLGRSDPRPPRDDGPFAPGCTTRGAAGD